MRQVIIYSYTYKKAVKLLATQARRTNLSATDLCKVHFEMGKYLAYEMLEELELEEIEIMHVQGQRKGVQLKDKDDIAIIALMRSGLYAAEGIRSVFTEAAFILESNDIEHICTKFDLSNKIAIVVDAVINTGKTIKQVVDVLKKNNCRKIFVTTLILQSEAVTFLEENIEDITVYALRISDNKYVGKGSTDTGNRLFNTKNIE